VSALGAHAASAALRPLPNGMACTRSERPYGLAWAYNRMVARAARRAAAAEKRIGPVA